MPKQLRVLIVEDETLVSEMIQGMLRELGYSVIGRAIDGQQAIDMACTLHPDLIFMDIGLPGMDGIETTQRIYDTRPVPVVALTAYDNEELVERASVAGVGSYLLKPPNPQEIERAVTITLARFHDMVELRRVNTQLQTEITERRHKEEEIRRLNNDLEERVYQRTLDLETANKDLRDFVYAASHDLKTPLRGIAQIAYWLVQDYADLFDDAGKTMVDLLIKRVKRLDGFLNGIQEYAGIGQSLRKEEPIDVTRLIESILSSLSAPETMTFHISSELPVIMGNRKLISQLFRHVLRNAVDFMDKPDGEVCVACVEHDTDWIFRIIDNGPGIAPQYHEKIFQIFQTLSRRDDRESLGIGLAIVKKIVHLLHGSVHVESAPGEGSTFVITLPKERQKFKK